MLVRTKETLKTQLGTIQKNVNYDTFLSYIETAEQQYLIPLIGQEQYDALNVADFASLTEPQAKLLTYCQPIVCFYALYEIFPLLNIAIGEQGIVKNIDEKFEPADEKSVYEARIAVIRIADQRAEILLTFLEKNSGTYPLWAESEAYTIDRTLFIANANELHKLVSSISNSFASRRLYQRIKSELAHRERVLQRAITPTLFTELKADMPSDLQKDVILRLKQYLAYKVLADTLPSLGASIKDGMLVFKSVDKQMQAIIENLEDRSQEAMLELYAFLNDNADALPSWKDSANYTAPPIELDTTSDNANQKTFFV